MIEIVIADRCTTCNACVTVCPTNVFDTAADGRPVIARQADCQTCFMCELYCKADALYVAPDCDGPAPVDAAAILASNLLGQFRRCSVTLVLPAPLCQCSLRPGEGRPRRSLTPKHRGQH